ncbi:MAG TPA: hypothetical protein VK680_07605 [Solirubrobacteraceae bacterium]|jgi:hypothetical protein|nr:hypothetical protein [Solirubrobacteraceae bacterium]
MESSYLGLARSAKALQKRLMPVALSGGERLNDVGLEGFLKRIAWQKPIASPNMLRIAA